MMESSFAILRTLHEEHFATMALLEKLETALSSNRTPPANDDSVMNGLLGDVEAVLHEEISHHYSFEEGHLFPLFAQFGDDGITQMLLGEHEIIRPLAGELAELAKIGRKEGFTPETWDVFREKGQELVEREVFHIQKEEMGFLPGLDQIIDSDQDSELSMIYVELKNAA
jgi:DUF438 domain-containing protein